MLSRIDGAFLALDTEHGIYRDHYARNDSIGIDGELLTQDTGKERDAGDLPRELSGRSRRPSVISLRGGRGGASTAAESVEHDSGADSSVQQAPQVKPDQMVFAVQAEQRREARHCQRIFGFELGEGV
jgi:hypothetical protein